ncbi:hypothetical protein NDU88_003130 [Pleurodeles waltl]|uniref:Uncharacterized protein n=1 Tax=Pleurodeles waltl TaxID=8319 RepID=A0AAV7KY25_PLEWA|nr:hypothetical protein NDU88_003130 [Pleurodeles waltl]
MTRCFCLASISSCSLWRIVSTAPDLRTVVVVSAEVFGSKGIFDFHTKDVRSEGCVGTKVDAVSTQSFSIDPKLGIMSQEDGQHRSWSEGSGGRQLVSYAPYRQDDPYGFAQRASGDKGE